MRAVISKVSVALDCLISGSRDPREIHSDYHLFGRFRSCFGAVRFASARFFLFPFAEFI